MAPVSTDNPEIVRFRLNAAEAVRSIVSSRLEKSVTARIVDKLSELENPCIWLTQAIQHPRAGSFIWGIAESQWFTLASLFKNHRDASTAIKDKQPSDPNRKQLLEEIQKLTSEWTAQFGTGLKWHPPQKSTQRPPVLKAGFQFFIELQAEDELPFLLEIACSQEIVNLSSNIAISKIDRELSNSTSFETRNLELLLDVELPVSISFGSTKLALKDAIKLTNGSIVELNRSVSDPIEVIVNNCVIARGEVVAVEGNLGVRIQQIVSRQERLRTVS